MIKMSVFNKTNDALIVTLSKMSFKEAAVKYLSRTSGVRDNPKVYAYLSRMRRK